MHIRPTTLFLSLVIFCNEMSAQEPYFDEESYASQVSTIKHVTAIAADKNNCIWLATQTGLFRYDGNQFTHYSVLNTPVLKFERMAYMSRLKGNNGSRWCVFDIKGNCYQVDSLSQIQPFSYRVDDDEQMIYNKYSFPDFGNSRIDDSLREKMRETYILRSSGKVFIETAGNIVNMSLESFLNGSRGSVIYKVKNENGGKTFATDKNFYLVTPGGLLRWTDATRQSQSISLAGDISSANSVKINYDSLKPLNTTVPGIILFWYKGNIYEATESAGNTSLSTRLLIKGNDKEEPRAVFYSPEQKLFISYYINKGVVLYRPRQFSLFTWHVPGVIAKPEDYYYSFLAFNNGFVTINSAGVVWLGMNGEQKQLNKKECFKYFLFKDRLGNIWHQQSADHYICYVDSHTENIIPVTRFGQGEVFTGMHQSDDSTFYILTNRSLRRVVVSKGIAAVADVLYTAPAGTECNMLYALSSGTFWLGTDRGLKEFTLAQNNIKDVADLDNTNIRAITKLEENNYLVGTYDRGIYQFRNGEWTHLLSAGKGMPASAHAFVIDKSTSSVWVSSNQGISRIPLQQLRQKRTENKSIITFRHFVNFGPDISPEFNGSSNVSAAQLSDSCIVFANAKGLVVFNPLQLVSYPLPVNVLVEPATENRDNSISNNSISQNGIEFNPVVPYFGAREDLEVLYRLTNVDEGWHNLLPNAVISYKNVQPGDHDLQFRIRNYHDPEGKEVSLTAKSFSIPHRWYQHTWFLITAGIFIILMLGSLHYVRIWYILKRRKELAQLVKMKTSELHEANENLLTVISDLSISESNLKQSNFLKDEYYAVLTHDIRSPLKFLSFHIRHLLELLPGVSDEAMKNGLFAAYQCSNDVYKLIDEFVCWIQDNEKQLPVHALPTMILAVAEDAKKMYTFNLEVNKNELINDIPVDLNFVTDPKLLFIILRNAIDNANKYTSNGTIVVAANRQNNNLHLTISDTGRGIKEDMVRHLIQLQHGHVQLTYKEQKSLGFYIMAMLIKKLGGSYSITSEKGQSTNIYFTIPELTG